jgi:uncharacterized protein YgiM (DUF1202 family)
MMMVSAAVFAGTTPKEVSVTAKEGSVKVKADHLSKNVEVVAYGDKLKIVMKENDWYQVTTPSGKTGWIHESATTTKKIKLAKDAQVGDGSASHDEVALAGKGFNKQVEQSYVTSNPDVARAYQLVNQIEAKKVTAAQLSAFIKQGQLK